MTDTERRLRGTCQCGSPQYYCEDGCRACWACDSSSCTQGFAGMRSTGCDNILLTVGDAVPLDDDIYYDYMKPFPVMKCVCKDCGSSNIEWKAEE